ncbi:MAG: peptide chain release factor N(5)-glutamine methyltransferase [Candidatus Krumholzibacteriota bacterium]|nr:peptide chain release factor N(5)-glutamine methyltransferase [Candidatus Krumholzibacteriota bacterium]
MMFEAFRKAIEAFKRAGVADPLGETLRLMDIRSAGALRETDAGLLGEGGVDLDALAAGRAEGVPTEYILGEAPFLGLMLHCGPGALIPREETEILARAAIVAAERVGANPLVIELGTGSGNIAVALAMNVPGARIHAADISEEAVDMARRNVERYGLGDRVELSVGDLFAPLADHGLEGTVDLVVCNPPYIPTGSLEKLAAEIIDHEPRVALEAGAYGIDIFRRLIAESPVFLRPGGVLIFEIGAGQEKIAERLLRKAPDWRDPYFERDREGQVRVMGAMRA